MDTGVIYRRNTAHIKPNHGAITNVCQNSSNVIYVPNSSGIAVPNSSGTTVPNSTVTNLQNANPNVTNQCCKFLSPGRPRLPGLGSGYLLPEARSPSGRPKMTISQLLVGLQKSITTQIAVQRVD